MKWSCSMLRRTGMCVPASATIQMTPWPSGSKRMDPVEGRQGVFTPVDRNDIAVIVDGRGKLIATDSAGQPVRLQALGDTGDDRAATTATDIPADKESAEIRVEYQGRKGTIFKPS